MTDLVDVPGGRRRARVLDISRRSFISTAGMRQVDAGSADQAKRSSAWQHTRVVSFVLRIRNPTQIHGGSSVISGYHRETTINSDK
jgi:hypothetical protein